MRRDMVSELKKPHLERAINRYEEEEVDDAELNEEPVEESGDEGTDEGEEEE